MKHLKIYIAVALMGLLAFNTGCKKYLEDAFPNPNKPVNANPDTVFPAVTSIMARGIMFDGRFLNSYTQYWARTAAGDAWDLHGYAPGSDNGSDIWRSHYFGFGQNVLNIIRDGKELDIPAYAGAGYAIFAWSWLLLTDYHGEVILKEAFRPEQLTFNYDQQQDVYEHVKKLADTALIYLNQAKGNANPRFANGDKNFYKGDVDKWIKFVYAVKAMVYHRYINKSNYNADSVIINADKAFASPADDALVQHPLSTINEHLNFYGPRRGNLSTARPSSFLIKLLDGSAQFPTAVDPRLKFLFKAPQDEVYRGLEPGKGEASLTVAQRPPNFWGFYATAAPAGGDETQARSYFKNNGAFPILTYAQIQFVKAEAAFKKGDKTTALDAYKKGINGSLDHLQMYYTGYTNWSPAQRTAFLNNTSVVPAVASDLTLSQIMLQKYLALWPYGGNETWVDLRKYQYNPAVYTGWTMPASFYTDNGGLAAQRVRPRYNSEYLWNVESLRTIGALELNYHTKPVWFTTPN
jgi:hypothetical protein